MWFNTVKHFYDAGYPQYTDEGIKGFVITKIIYGYRLYQFIYGDRIKNWNNSYSI